MKRRKPTITARAAAARALQDRRRKELDQLRLQRPLTAEERDEDERLSWSLYRRVWRDEQRAAEARIAENLAAVGKTTREAKRIPA